MKLVLVLLPFLAFSAVIHDPKWQSLSDAAEVARTENIPLLVYVHAPWCGPCLKMEKDVFPTIAPLMNRFSLAGLDYDDNESLVEAYGNKLSPLEWAIRYGAEATPTFILLTPDGSLITRASGYIDTQGFSLLLSYVATNAYHHTSFEDYVATIQY